MTTETMTLTAGEATALAHLVVARQIHYCDTWLEWEDYPQLDAGSFDRLTQAVKDLALHHSDVSKHWQAINGIDANDLYERATP